MFVIVGPYFLLFRFSKLFSELSWSYLLFFSFLYFGALQFFPEWLWSMFGKEIITISSDGLKHKRSILGFGLTRAFNKNEVKDIRASGYFEPEKPIKKFSKKFGLKLGAIAIDYSDSSYRFGIRLREKEAMELTTELNNFLTKAWSRRREDRGFTQRLCQPGIHLDRCSRRTLCSDIVICKYEIPIKYFP